MARKTIAALEAEIAGLRAENERLRLIADAWQGHACVQFQAPACTCASPAMRGLSLCPAHGWPQRIFTTTIRPWTNMCAGAAIPQTVILPLKTNAGQSPFIYEQPFAANGCAGGAAFSQVLTITNGVNGP